MFTKSQIQERVLNSYTGKRNAIVQEIVNRLPDNYELYFFTPTTLIAENILLFTKTRKEYEFIYNLFDMILNYNESFDNREELEQ